MSHTVEWISHYVSLWEENGKATESEKKKCAISYRICFPLSKKGLMTTLPQMVAQTYPQISEETWHLSK